MGNTPVWDVFFDGSIMTLFWDSKLSEIRNLIELHMQILCQSILQLGLVQFGHNINQKKLRHLQKIMIEKQVSVIEIRHWGGLKMLRDPNSPCINHAAGIVVLDKGINDGWEQAVEELQKKFTAQVPIFYSALIESNKLQAFKDKVNNLNFKILLQLVSIPQKPQEVCLLLGLEEYKDKILEAVKRVKPASLCLGVPPVEKSLKMSIDLAKIETTTLGSEHKIKFENTEDYPVLRVLSPLTDVRQSYLMFAMYVVLIFFF